MLKRSGCPAAVNLPGLVSVEHLTDEGVHRRAVSVRHFNLAHRFPRLAAIAKIEILVHEKGKTSVRTRFYVSSRPASAAELAEAVRSHSAIENSLHWVLDVAFGEDKARSRTGDGPANMPAVRHFAFNIL